MDSTSYVALARQRGLKREMTLIANNIANLSTAGFRGQGIVFSEYIVASETGAPSVSMTDAGAFKTNFREAGHRQTGGTFDLAIDGDAFFQVQTDAGLRLTRGGAFRPNAEGELVTATGAQVLDAGGAPVFIPPGAGAIVIAPDGTLSADGTPVAQIGLVTVERRDLLSRDAHAGFIPDGPVLPAPSAFVRQGFLEDSNVDPVIEVARMIEVQRRYEAAKSFLEREDSRIRDVMKSLTR